MVLGFDGNADWRDMSEFVVHFTKAGEESAYDTMLRILGTGEIRATSRFGMAKGLDALGDSQRSACFSEIPLDLLGRLVDRRSRYGIAFKKDFVVSSGGGPVWYVPKGGPLGAIVDAMNGEAVSPWDENHLFWKLTPFIDRPGVYGAKRYEFEWEREWRVPGGLKFTPEDVAFLFFPEREHDAAATFLAHASAEQLGTAYMRPLLDPRWGQEQILRALE